jgi:hypothetical protein
MSRATLNDLVEDFVRLQLGYGEKDIVVNNDVGILYDADETENLTKKLIDLGTYGSDRAVDLPTDQLQGIKRDTFLTIIDEDDDEPFVNVVINIQEASVRSFLKFSPHLLRLLTSSTARSPEATTSLSEASPWMPGLRSLASPERSLSTRQMESAPSGMAGIHGMTWLQTSQRPSDQDLTIPKSPSPSRRRRLPGPQRPARTTALCS